jgi:hypothetical protein
MKRKAPDTSSDTEKFISKRRSSSPATSSEASTEVHSNRSQSPSIEIQTQNIIELAAEHRGNPGKLTQTLLNDSYELEAIEKAFLFLEQSQSFPQHKSLAIRNAIENIQEANRELLIKNQAALIIEQIESFEGDPGDLIEALLDYSDYKGKHYKPDAFKFVLDHYSFPSETDDAIKKAYIDSKIGYVKEREFDPAGAKPDGITSGGQVRKTQNYNDHNVKKHKNIWLQKTGVMTQGLIEDVCEYIGTNLINHMMDKTSPKLRLHRDEYGDITLLSKYLEDFETLRDKDPRTARELIRRSENFANFFAANILIGDYDIHPGNVGIITQDRHYIARIDNGCALSYNMERNFGGRIKKTLPGLQSVEGFKQTMLSLPIYSQEMFEGIEFTTDLQQAINDINPEDMRQIVDLSIHNLKDAYGEHFLNDYKIAKDLKERMGISPPITEEAITNTIIGNMVQLKKELNEFAINEMRHFFPTHPKRALEECVRLKKENSGFIDYEILLDNLQAAFPKFDPQQQRHLRTCNNSDLEIAKIEAIANKLSKSSNHVDSSSHTIKKQKTPDKTPINIGSSLKNLLNR